MKKVELALVAKALKDANIGPAESRKVIERLNLELDDAAKNAPHHGATPKTKKQFVILASDPEGKLKGIDLTGWVLQIEDSASPATTVDRIKEASIQFNNSRKGRLLPVQTIGETLEAVGRRFFDVNNPDNTTLVKTKTPVLILTTNNKLV